MESRSATLKDKKKPASISSVIIDILNFIGQTSQEILNST